MVTILGLECIQVKGEIVRIMTRIRREGRLISALAVSFFGSVLSSSWIQVFLF